ncbi:hypothetical protein P43SY_007203 [Pythium insidiosum]|uniref:Histone RNA hairpin-binding protein RNA-binding domain-containing protein n=1 Tax=Pythium insidiosum TaxID=114742 RepID=A0AAD5LFQ6_PYTIN|nr:hypothetical protein P43SY_007203 [Pythium insidiosum]
MKRQWDDALASPGEQARTWGPRDDAAKRMKGNRSSERPVHPRTMERDTSVVRTMATERETDEHRLSQRQKQIDYGKNTLGYDRYCAQVPRHKRRKGDPMTPDKTLKVSKKGFDAMVRRWRQALHRYDPPELANAQSQPAVSASPVTSVAVEQALTADAHPVSQPVQRDDTDGPRSRAFSDPDLYDLDPARYAPSSDTASKGPSIFDNFEDDEALETAVDYEEEDDDDLL